MDKNENRQLFLNIKESLSNTDGISNVETQLDDKNYSLACNVCNGDRLAFGIKKTDGIAFIKSSVKTMGLNDSQVIEMCENVTGQISTTTYTVHVGKVVFQKMIPAKLKTFEENDDLVFSELKQFIEMMTQCCEKLGTGSVVKLQRKKYEKHKKEREKVMNNADDTLMNMESYISDTITEEELQPVEDIEEVEKEEKLQYQDLSEEDYPSSSEEEFTGIIRDNEEENDNTIIEEDNKLDKYQLENSDIVEQVSEDINEKPLKEVASSIERPMQFQKNTYENKKPVVQQQDKSRNQGRKNDREERKFDNQNTSSNVQDNRRVNNISQQKNNIFVNYERDLRNVENKYRNQIRNMSVDDLLKLIEDRYIQFYDSENKVEISDYIKEKICEIAKAELKFRLSKR